ncbi:MAG TPA: 16S rRNA (cytidine(1402)-2'-O)-methyltransferase [Candidatus Binatia bacterium]|nr:16S rRNA (cytidine(1402)-2'-O)-methyltransferase [Candidatus Binatia bacterium]
MTDDRGLMTEPVIHFFMPGILYIVATPIGNLEDITLRALRVLKEVDVIAAEDTRHTRILLNHYAIQTPLTSYHEHNERTKGEALVKRLLQGENMALVSDAGTPSISDPGLGLVVQAIHAGIQIIPLPGASALTAVLSASGLPTDRVAFEGFLPAKKKPRREKLQALQDEARTLVFYEAPHRLMETLDDVYELLGDREAVVAREVSKVHEEFVRGRISELSRVLGRGEIRGEITLAIAGSAGEFRVTEDRLKAEIRELQRRGMRVKEIAEVLGEKFGYPKKEIYRLALVGEKINS